MAHDLHDYLLDLKGYLVLKGAVDAQHVAELNEALDSEPRDLARREWWRNCQLSSDSAEVVSFETIVEAGEPFERLIDHPSWIERVRRYCGEQDSYDFEGLCLDTATAMLRRTGGFVAMHPGAGEHALRTLYHFFDQRWYCGQVNILLALTDIGPGDGATVVIPASHKENFAHPEVDEAGDGSSPPAGSASPARSRSTSTRATRCCSSTGSATAATRARTRASDGS